MNTKINEAASIVFKFEEFETLLKEWFNKYPIENDPNIPDYLHRKLKEALSSFLDIIFHENYIDIMRWVNSCPNVEIPPFGKGILCSDDNDNLFLKRKYGHTILLQHEVFICYIKYKKLMDDKYIERLEKELKRF